MTTSSGVAHELFAAHYLGFVRLAMQVVDDQESAEDLVQDVFVGLTRRSSVPDDLLLYLRRAVVNRANTVLRRRRVARAVLIGAGPDRTAAPADADGLQRDETRAMLALIAGLARRLSPSACSGAGRSPTSCPIRRPRRPPAPADPPAPFLFQGGDPGRPGLREQERQQPRRRLSCSRLAIGVVRALVNRKGERGRFGGRWQRGVASVP